MPHLQQVREQVLAALKQSPAICPMTPTQGAFYQLIKLNTERNDLDLVQDLIRDYQVAAIPGSAFGLQEGAYLRLSYGMLDLERSSIAMERLLTGLAALC